MKQRTSQFPSLIRPIICVGLVFVFIFCCSLDIMAAQPTWVAKTLINMRKAALAASKAKNAGKVVVTVGKCANALPDEEIEQLAKTAAKPGGITEVGKILGTKQLPKVLGEEAGNLVLEDTYLRIAIKNEKISKNVADDVLKTLSGTPGLTSLLKKINSASASQAKGHMRELEIALQAKKRGFIPLALGEKFVDPQKSAQTDLDVVLRMGKKNFAIESKAYAGSVPEDMVRADAESLLVFCEEISKEEGITIPVFCFENEPSKVTKAFLEKRGVECIFGTAEEIATKLDFLFSNLK